MAHTAMSGLQDPKKKKRSRGNKFEAKAQVEENFDDSGEEESADDFIPRQKTAKPATSSLKDIPVKSSTICRKDGREFVQMRVSHPHPHVWMFPLQPKSSAYGGMGFANPSVWVSLQQGDFSQEFEKIFSQHVDFGSTGKAFIKGFKREREANMLWRVKLKEKFLRHETKESRSQRSYEDVVPKAKVKKSEDARQKSDREDQHRHESVHKGRVVQSVRPREQLAEDGRDNMECAESSSVCEKAQGAEPAKQALTAKERVKRRREKAVQGVRRDALPKVPVNASLQQQAIQAYRMLKQQQQMARQHPHAKSSQIKGSNHVSPNDGPRPGFHPSRRTSMPGSKSWKH